MTVNGEPRHTARRSQAERSATTRAALLEAARALFAAQGFAGTGREEIVERAGVTRGAMYHHFASKEDLFRAVYEELETELCDAVARAALAGDGPREQLRLGALAFLDAAADPAVRRVVLLDAPSVLPAELLRELSEKYGLGMVRASLQEAMAAGAIERQPLEPLARLVLAALHEAASLVAEAPDARAARAARAEVGGTVERLLARL
jgi:AcrR family transcriptional regulator